MVSVFYIIKVMTKLDKKYKREESEERWKKFWEEEGVFKFKDDPKKEMYVVDTPPPYVSADHLHAGHIMSYAQAEFVVRYKRMRGFNVYYPMGFDDNGLPTERFVEKKHKVNKKKISKADFIKLCLAETKKGAKVYRDLWTDLGISVDWSKTYSTIDPKATKVSQWSLIDLYKKGALYRKESPTLWCPLCQTALAQADMEDEESDSKMNYIKFKKQETRNKKQTNSKSQATNSELTIMTTRPELIPGCVALYVNPKDERFKDVVGGMARVPLMDYEVPIRASENVDMETGTGLMMVCTWGDQEDVEKWMEDELDTRSLVTEDGRLNSLGGKYERMKLLGARKEILSDLKEAGLLIKQEDLTHAVNVHERCGTPVEFIQSKQWFIKTAGMEDVWLKRGKEMDWFPKHMFKRYESWVKSLKWDWCVSRQRYYGVMFPIWYCEKCDEPIFADEKDLPVNPHEDNPQVNKCPKCGYDKFIPEEDVMDTWATSGSSPYLVSQLVDDKKVQEKLYPNTLRPNAHDIIRTWVFYSVVKSHYNFGSVPFENVMISGHGIAADGKKFSKRLGNFKPAEDLVKEYGADPIRYWATGATLGQDLKFSVEEIKKGQKTINKLWNVGRLIEMHFDKSQVASLKSQELEYADLWILKELGETVKKVTEAFDNYTYSKARDEIDAFFWGKFTDYYIEFVKYRLFGDDEKSKQSAVFTLLIVFKDVLKMYAPIIPFVTEELYQAFYITTPDPSSSNEGNQKEKSIHVSEWPKESQVTSRKLQDLDVDDFDNAVAAIDEVRKYKSKRGISQGEELEEFSLSTEVDVSKYGEFISRVVRVKKLV